MMAAERRRAQNFFRRAGYAGARQSTPCETDQNRKGDIPKRRSIMSRHALFNCSKWPPESSRRPLFRVLPGRLNSSEDGRIHHAASIRSDPGHLRGGVWAKARQADGGQGAEDL